MSGEPRDMKPVLCAGLVCLDQVTIVTTFPREDTDMRSLNQYKVNIITITHHIQYIFHNIKSQKVVTLPSERQSYSRYRQPCLVSEHVPIVAFNCQGNCSKSQHQTTGRIRTDAHWPCEPAHCHLSYG